MLVKKQNQSFFLPITFFLSVSTIFSQNTDVATETKLKASVQLVPFFVDISYPINREVKNIFQNALETKNVLIEKNANWELAIYAEEDSAKDEVKISITQMAALPEIAIQLLAENEVYYRKTLNEKIMPEEGKIIRQELTKEHMYNYRMPRLTNILHVKRANLKKVCEDYVNSFYHTRLLNRK